MYRVKFGASDRSDQIQIPLSGSRYFRAEIFLIDMICTVTHRTHEILHFTI